ncbi:30S ribosomal protein S6 [Candidatus Kaiserbacteria bacterium]|nr:30S ribosomal protein S6 [Candidatus Kaiserbacteria bacterium]
MAKEKDSALRAEEAFDGEPRVYELGFHLDPELPAEEAKKAYQAIRSQISEGGTIIAEGEPEKVSLAYTISRQETSGRRDFDSAYFCWIAYETNTERHGEIVAAAGANKRIIRFIDIATTKEAARHALEALELAAKTEKEKRAPEAALDAELDAALESAVA